MVCKTFNVNEKTYKEFSEFCKGHGLSMSKQIEVFMEAQLSEGKVRKEYLKKLDKIRKGRFIEVKDFRKRYLK
jgi:antitoxin component of RelBE/YafQ-DinJ toxin-antitoxin module